MTLINKNVGVVCEIFNNRSEVTILLPNGGKLTAPNEGFNLGDEICFDVNPDGEITKIRSKLVADVMAQVGLDYNLSVSIRDPEHEEENEFELIPNEEEVFDDDEFGDPADIRDPNW